MFLGDRGGIGKKKEKRKRRETVVKRDLRANGTVYSVIWLRCYQLTLF